jgi:futalosine hydrolase
VKILLVAATDQEISALRERIMQQPIKPSIDFLVTGIGMVATTYALTKKLQEDRYDLVIALGIAGAIDHRISIGEVVCVDQDEIYNFGVEDGSHVLPFSAIGLDGDAVLKPLLPFSSSLVQQLKWVKAVSVNTAHGNQQSIGKLVQCTEASIETMEGAAFFYVCNQEKVSCLHLRAVSNRVERRNRETWDIPLALDQLTTTAYSILNTL